MDGALDTAVHVAQNFLKVLGAVHNLWVGGAYGDLEGGPLIFIQNI